HLEKRLLEQSVIKSYRAGSEIVLEDLPVVEPFVRKLFLSWIGKAMARADYTIKTEHGDRIMVELDRTRKITLRAKDGQLQMPAVTFHYLEKEKAK
ncbi:DUF2397 family protein, partial [Cytobacillus firmus]